MILEGLERLTFPNDIHRFDKNDEIYRSDAHCSNTTSRFGGPQTVIDVIIGRARLTSDLYDVNLPAHVFTRIFDKIHDGNYTNVGKIKYKSYAYRDFTCDNYENNDVRTYKTVILGVECWDDSTCCVGVSYVKDKMPVSSFPCTMDLDNTAYVKCSTIKIHPRVSVIFESKMDKSDSVVNKVIVRTVLNSKLNEDGQKILDVIRHAVKQVCAFRDAAVIETKP